METEKDAAEGDEGGCSLKGVGVKTRRIFLPPGRRAMLFL
jgi:hypothetical protein